MDKINCFHRDDSGEEFLIVGSRFQNENSLVKEGTVLLKGHEIGRTSSGEDDTERGVSSAFLFVLDKLESCCSNSRLPIINGYHTYVTTGIHSKMVSDGDVEVTCDM